MKDSNGKAVAAYDTYRIQKLVKSSEKDKARYNADSFSMFARVREPEKKNMWRFPVHSY